MGVRIEGNINNKNNKGFPVDHLLQAAHDVKLGSRLNCDNNRTDAGATSGQA